MKYSIKIFTIVVIATVFIATSVFSQEDLSIRYIQRLPEMEFVHSSSNPAVEGWPAEGDDVTWRATVKNWGTQTATVSHRWYLDDVPISGGSRTIDGGTETVFDSPAYNWTFERKVLRFVIDIGNSFDEVEEDNNEVEIFTDAISVGFYVEQSVYDHFHEHQHKLNVGSNNFEDWAHRQVDIWNGMLASAVYPDSPNGVLDRIRLDKITVKDDGVLTAHGGTYATNNPTDDDQTVDLLWGFPKAIYLDVDDYFKKYTNASLTNAFYYDAALFHELGHARYLIDIYGFNMRTDNTRSTYTIIDIEENGVDIDESGLFPLPYHVDMPGLMNSHYTFSIDEYSVMALNLIAGQRAFCGNKNAPCNIGSEADGFMQDLPTENRILITDSNGLPVRGASIQIYQGTQGVDTLWYSKTYDNVPDLTLTSNSQGYVDVGTNPFSNDIIIHTRGHANSNMIIRVEKDGNVAYNVLGSWQFNMEYWRGNTDLGTYQLAFDNVIGTPAECATSHEITSHASTSEYLAATNHITSSATIAANVDITYDAGTRVRLIKDFHARRGSTFHAFIDGCDDSSVADKQETSFAPDIRLYPNPATHTIHVEYELSENSLANISIFDAFGKVVKNVPNIELFAGTQTLNTDISDLPAGMYFYTIQAKDWKVTKKFITVNH